VVRRQTRQGERTSAADLIEVFEARPYAWEPWPRSPSWAACRRLGKVRATREGDPEPNEVDPRCPNTGRQGAGAGPQGREQNRILAASHAQAFSPALLRVASSALIPATPPTAMVGAGA